MNYTKEQLKLIKEAYEVLAFALIKRDKSVVKEYNIILDLIEDLEELNSLE